MTIAIILSGGVGTRIGGERPKQYIEVKSRPVIADCIDVFEKHADVDGYIIVAMDEWHGYIKNFTGAKFMAFASPGINRQLSIYSGLKSAEHYVDDDDTVIIHDAARPFVKPETITELINACTTYDGAMPALSVKDTMYIKKDGKVDSLIDRESIIAGQAPEAFKFKKYLSANEALLPDRIKTIKGSTEPAFLYGMNIKVIDGDEGNFKITTKEDLERYESICVR